MWKPRRTRRQATRHQVAAAGSAIQGGAVVVKKPGALGRLYERLVLSLLAIIVTFVSKKTPKHTVTTYNKSISVLE